MPLLPRGEKSQVTDRFAAGMAQQNLAETAGNRSLSMARLEQVPSDPMISYDLAIGSLFPEELTARLIVTLHHEHGSKNLVEGVPSGQFCDRFLVFCPGKPHTLTDQLKTIP